MLAVIPGLFEFVFFLFIFHKIILNDELDLLCHPTRANAYKVKEKCWHKITDNLTTFLNVFVHKLTVMSIKQPKLETKPNQTKKKRKKFVECLRYSMKLSAYDDTL